MMHLADETIPKYMQEPLLTQYYWTIIPTYKGHESLLKLYSSAFGNTACPANLTSLTP